MVFHFVNEIELGLLSIQKGGDGTSLHRGRQVEDAHTIAVVGLVAEMGNECSSQARLADARGAIEKYEFALGQKIRNEPGLLSRRLFELKGTGHGMLHKE